jgi:ubiquinone/menaquinone biosynthesis C-methylase UbiE
MKRIISKAELNEIIEHENKHWSKIFAEEKQKISNNLYSSYWWQDYYNQITMFVQSNIKNGSSVIELGSGSGKASLLLGNRYKKHLFDISPEAIKFAKLLSERLEAKNVKFTLGDGFNTNLPSKSYDLVWNIGVIEHYTPIQASAFVKEMVRITKNSGHFAVAVPNFNSFQIWKAQKLNMPIFKHIPGYRLDSEEDYKIEDLQNIIQEVCNAENRKIVSQEIRRLGNPLPMSSSKLVITTIGRPINYLFKKNRFLLMIMVELE